MPDQFSHLARKDLVSRASGQGHDRAKTLRALRHTFISVGLSNGVNIKWLADYCGTSVAMIEQHYGKYIRNDADEQLRRLKTVTLIVPPAGCGLSKAGATAWNNEE